MPTLEARLNDVEIKLSFAEDQIDALNQTIYKQQQVIDQLIAAIKDLREQGRSQGQAGSTVGGFDAGFEKPPHY